MDSMDSRKALRSRLGFKTQYFSKGKGKLSKIIDEFFHESNKNFEKIGRMCLVILLKNGLYPENKVLDVGCGSLRGGYWVINFLNPNCYYGIEPDQEKLEIGKSKILGREILEDKKPQFDFNEDFNFNCFNQKFDFVIARSIWTHASKKQIIQMLESFIKTKTKHGVFLTSYRRGYDLTDYKGNEWVGKSHKSNTKGIVAHNFEWIKKVCKERNLDVIEFKDETINLQIWLRIIQE